MRHLMFLPAAALALFTVGFAPSAEAVTSVTVGQPVFVGDTYGSRYKDDRGGDNHYVGVDDLGDPVNREEAAHRYVLGENTFSLGYDAGSGVFTSVFNGGTLTYLAPDGLSFDTIGMWVRDTTVGTARDLRVTGLTLDGTALTAPSDGWGVDGASTNYTISGFSSLTSFLLEGVIEKTGSLGGNEGQSVTFSVGNVNVIPLPAGAWVLISGFAAAAGLRRMTRKAA